MKIAELSRRSGIPQATVKYYIREGLLPPGLKTAPNQAQYSNEHLGRLKLISVLREVGGLSIDALRSVIAALASPGPRLLATAHMALSPPQGGRTAPERDPTWHAVAAELADYLRGLGWTIYEESPTFGHLVDVYVSIRDAWPGGLEMPPLSVTNLRTYADAMHEVATSEVGGEINGARLPPEDQLRWVVLGTVLFEPLLLALRRVAQEDLAIKRFGL